MKQKAAITIFLTILILSIILIVSLGAAFLMLGQIKMSQMAEESVRAFYAADAGAEQALYKTRKEDFCLTLESDCLFDGKLDNTAAYLVDVKFKGEDKPHEITSKGFFDNISRRIKL